MINNDLEVYLQDEGMKGLEKEFISVNDAFASFDLKELSDMAQIIGGFSCKNLFNYCAGFYLKEGGKISFGIDVFTKFLPYLCSKGVLKKIESEDGNRYFVMPLNN